MYIGDRIRMHHVKEYLPYSILTECCLDIGCGDEKYKNLIKEHGYEYWGIDINPINESIRKINLDNIEDLIWLKGTEKNSLVLCIDVLEHLINPMRLLYLLPDLLKNKGRLILHTPNCKQTHLLIEPKKNPEHIRDGFTPENIKKILSNFFSRLEIIPTFDIPEALSWDLNYIMSGKNAEEMILEGIEKLIKFDESQFVPYGMLIIGDR